MQPDPIIPQMARPEIPGGDHQIKKQGAGGISHRPHPEHTAKQDLDRNDKSNLVALRYSVEVAKTRPTEKDADIIARAATFRKFLKGEKA